ncbi:hypothetical protein QUF74_16210 [Candidatus Halobeggiatoa sp. HSG11]|nr:hypothetical protein [Candidatus Halobeggiatoa sp. HSG11]
MEFLTSFWVQLTAFVLTVIGGLSAIWFFWDMIFHKEKPSQSQADSEKLMDFITKFPKVLDQDNLKIDINRIPEPTAALVGRQEELAEITAAFEGEKTKVVAIIAGGGVGKSALTWNWLQQMQPSYGGAELVFGWSFYSQGSHQTANSSAPFFQEALPFFGFEGKLPSDEIEKARALAECLRDKRSLLILDGLEPLQHPPHIMGGELADVAIKELLRCVRYYGLGGERNLVLISSRQPMVDLEQFDGYLPMDLQTLDISDGAKLLQNLGCTGGLASLEAASRDMSGHALALVLLGKLLRERFDGRIEKRDSLPDLFEEAKEGGHALRVVRYYDEVYWQETNFLKRVKQNIFGEVPERALLQLLGLFDRPMGMAEKDVLVQKAELARPLTKLDAVEFRLVERRLEQAGLLLKCEGERWEWDTHPLIRSYFTKILQEKYSKLYKQAQLVLFDYYQDIQEIHQPDTLEELEPLYRAVVHGCLAGEYQKAREDVYRERIRRGKEAYSLHKLGAYAQDLTALASFFPIGWDKPVTTGLSEANQAWLLAEASFCLMSLGRLEEAAVPRQVATKIVATQKDWKNAAISAGTLVDLLLPIGQLQNAKQAAEQGIEYADKTDDLFRQKTGHSKLATTLHRQSDLATALEQFKETEKIQAKYDPENPRLYSLSGFLYCALLFDLNTPLDEIEERGQYALKIETTTPLLDFAFNNLTIARCQTSTYSKESFNKAVQGMRKAGRVDYMPEVLLARAKFHRQQQNFKQAQQDLDEVQDIIERCGMKLYLVDAMLLQANINLDLGKTFDTKPIKNLINLTGYHLRDPELDLVDARIALYKEDLLGFQNLVGLAREKIEKMGYWSLMPELERVEQTNGK